jgi:hypothetical protein
MKVGDLVIFETYWNEDRLDWGMEISPCMEGEKGVVLGLMKSWSSARGKYSTKAVVHFFNVSHKPYFYYSPRHLRPYKCPNYKGFNDESR